MLFHTEMPIRIQCDASADIITEVPTSVLKVKYLSEEVGSTKAFRVAVHYLRNTTGTPGGHFTI